jgi:hypothetical protein
MEAWAVHLSDKSEAGLPVKGQPVIDLRRLRQALSAIGNRLDLIWCLTYVTIPLLLSTKEVQTSFNNFQKNIFTGLLLF